MYLRVGFAIAWSILELERAVNAESLKKHGGFGHISGLILLLLVACFLFRPSVITLGLEAAASTDMVPGTWYVLALEESVEPGGTVVSVHDRVCLAGLYVQNGGRLTLFDARKAFYPTAAHSALFDGQHIQRSSFSSFTARLDPNDPSCVQYSGEVQLFPN